MTKNVVTPLSVVTGIIASIGLGRELLKVDDLGKMGHESLQIAACITGTVGETSILRASVGHESSRDKQFNCNGGVQNARYIWIIHKYRNPNAHTPQMRHCECYRWPNPDPIQLLLPLPFSRPPCSSVTISDIRRDKGRTVAPRDLQVRTRGLQHSVVCSCRLATVSDVNQITWIVWGTTQAIQ